MRYSYFLNDYVRGLLRRISTKKRVPYSKHACQAYFTKLQKLDYDEHFCAANFGFFSRPFRCSSTIRQLITSKAAIIVELGSGFGDLERSLNGWKSGTYLGLDWGHQMLQTARSLSKTADASYYVCADAEFSPFREGIADLILIANLTPYFSSVWSLAQEAGRIAKPHSVVALLYPIGNPFWEGDFEGVGLNYFDRGQIVGPFESEGYSVVHIESLSFELVPGTHLFSQHLADYIEFERS